MSFTHNTQILYKTTTQGVVITKTFTQTADVEGAIDTLVAAGAVNLHKPLVVTVANLKMLLITSTQSITIKTNSTSTPSQTLTVAAGQVITWSFGDGTTNPLTVDITDFYITNSNLTAALVQMRFLLNQ